MIRQFENLADFTTNRSAPRRPLWATVVAPPTVVTHDIKGVDHWERAPREPSVVGHDGKCCTRRGPTAVGDGGSRAYKRGDYGRRLPHP
jgi:hypothetical protein